MRYEVKPSRMRPGKYRNITGNMALALGLVAAGVRSKLPVFLGAYPITPASDILHELVQAQALQRDHDAGRGRDRGGRRGAGRLLRRSTRGDHDQRPGRGAQGGDHFAWR